MRTALFSVLLIGMTGCAPEPKPAPAPAKKAEAPKPRDESHRFPQKDQVDVKLIEKDLMGKVYMPGGNLAQYKAGKQKYELFLAKAPSLEDAPLVLLSFKKDLAGARLIPHFGGYFGEDAGQPLFVFTKGAWIAGVKGLPMKDADLVAREFAARLD